MAPGQDAQDLGGGVARPNRGAEHRAPAAGRAAASRRSV